VETSPSVMAALVGLFLGGCAIALAWLLYRLDRLHSRHRDLEAALAVVRGVKRGMVERVGDDVGWAEHFFTTVYTGAAHDSELQPRVQDAYDAVMGRDWLQVFPVPLAPLDLLVSTPATAGLLSDETVFIANVGLWRVRVFNEFVRMQTDFNARFLPEIRDEDLPEERRKAIAEGAASISQQLHLYGIGAANVEGGWYARLKRALDADIARLTEGALRLQRFAHVAALWRPGFLVARRRPCADDHRPCLLNLRLSPVRSPAPSAGAPLEPARPELEESEGGWRAERLGRFPRPGPYASLRRDVGLA
jgi:hypothetical protein